MPWERDGGMKTLFFVRWAGADNMLSRRDLPCRTAETCWSTLLPFPLPLLKEFNLGWLVTKISLLNAPSPTNGGED